MRNTQPANPNKPTGAESDLQFVLSSGNEKNPCLLQADQNRSLRLELWGGMESDYRISLFINNTPVKINGFPAFTIHTQYDKLISYSFEVPADVSGPLNVLYLCIIPTTLNLQSEMNGYKSNNIHWIGE